MCELSFVSRAWIGASTSLSRIRLLGRRTQHFQLTGVALVLLAGIVGCSSERDQACAALLKSKLAQDSARAAPTSRRTFYSTKLETCILVEESLIDVETVVDDLSDSFLQWGNLFHCDRDGVDAAILDSVRAYHGIVDNVPYSQWLDDGAGGAPRTLKSPSRPYSASACREALNKYLARVE